MDHREIIAAGDMTIWEELVGGIAANQQIKLLQKPETCVTMMQVKDSVGNTPFFLGEVLMTEAAVSINGQAGFGLVLEDDPGRALAMAVIDAALKAGIPECREIRQALSAQKERIAAKRREEEALVAATRVRFDIMEG